MLLRVCRPRDEPDGLVIIHAGNRSSQRHCRRTALVQHIKSGLAWIRGDIPWGLSKRPLPRITSDDLSLGRSIVGTHLCKGAHLSATLPEAQPNEGCGYFRCPRSEVRGYADPRAGRVKR